MTHTKLVLSVAVISGLLSSLPVHAQEPGGHPGVKEAVAEAKFDVNMQELELKMAELAVIEAKVEIEKTRLQLEAAEAQHIAYEVGHVKLELRQAEIRVEIRKVEAAMVRLHLQRAKVRLEQMRLALAEQPRTSSVRVENIEGTDVLVLRGVKGDVNRVRAVIERVEKTEGDEQPESDEQLESDGAARDSQPPARHDAD